MDLDTLLARFEREYLDLNSISAGRRRDQFRVLRGLAATFDRPLETVTVAEVQSFLGAMLNRGVNPHSVRLNLGMIRSFVTWASEAKLIEAERTVELKSISNPRGSAAPNIPKPYSATQIREFRALLQAKYPVMPLHGRDSRLLNKLKRGQLPALRRSLWRYARRLQFEAQIALALEEGLRTIEMHRLTIPAMHYDNDQIVVLTAKQGPGSKVRRAIPYTAHARLCAMEWLDFRFLLNPPHNHPWLALTMQGTLAQQCVPMGLRQWREALDVFEGSWDWHRLRHTAATEWLRAKVPLEKVRLYMGHADIVQTLAYAEILGRDIDVAFGDAEAEFARRLGLAA